jgi:hypothetical protein
MSLISGDLTAQADEALYRAKAKGRNGYAIAGLSVRQETNDKEPDARESNVVRLNDATPTAAVKAL